MSDNTGSTGKKVMDEGQEMKSTGSVERTKFVYEQISQRIDSADNKVNVSCGVFTGVFGVITFISEQYVKAPENGTINSSFIGLHMFSLIASLIAMAVAIVFFALAVIPNLKSSGANKSKKVYPVYFGDISSLKYDDYKKLMAEGKDKSFEDELILENWFNSRICMKKMRNYKYGVIASLIAIITAFVSLAAHYFMYL